MTQPGFLSGLILIASINGCAAAPSTPPRDFTFHAPTTRPLEVKNDDFGDRDQAPTLPPKHSPDFKANHEPLSAAINRLAQLTESRINFNKDAIQASAISLQSPVTVNVKNARISTVLKALLRQVKNGQLGYTFNSPDDILITTHSDPDMIHSVLGVFF